MRLNSVSRLSMPAAACRRAAQRCAAALVVAMSGTGMVQAQDAPIEYQVKASYLYNFIRFITWPPDVFRNGGSLNLCVTGAERFGSALDALAGESIEGRSIRVHRLGSVTEARHVRCQVLFVSAAEAPALPAALTPERGVLTVGETRGFLDRGGVINLVEVQGRIRFEVNQKAAKRAEIAMSSRLLRLSMERK